MVLREPNGQYAYLLRYINIKAEQVCFIHIVKIKSSCCIYNIAPSIVDVLCAGHTTRTEELPSEMRLLRLST